jgi:DNA polymerase elongation subunit (family B)
VRNDAIGMFWQDIPVTKLKKEKVKKVPVNRVWESPDFLPYYDEAIRFEINHYTDRELVNEAKKLKHMREKLVFDIESYWHYFCIAFRGVDSGKIFYVEKHLEDGLSILDERDVNKLNWVLDNFTVITFNGNYYDIPILTLALNYVPVDSLKEATNLLILGELEHSYSPVRPHDLLKRYKVKKLKNIDHIDLIEVAPLDGSLKVYAGRLHAQRLQDLPYDPETSLTQKQRTVVRWYCLNDLASTVLLYRDLEDAINLRASIGEKYGVDLRSKSDAQIAESIIRKEIYFKTGYEPQRPKDEEIDAMVGTAYKYEIPSYISYQTPNMCWVLETLRHSLFVVGISGRVTMPEALESLAIPINKGLYRMGIGGLHSSEETVSYVSDNEYIIVDRDVTSYYPYIILNQRLYPKHLGETFLDIFKSIVERRVSAKQAGDKLTAETLKITVNGSFGKTGNKYSLLYEPRLVMQTTVTGQLSLLMLIETLELKGFEVISANTDGVVTKVKRDRKDEFDKIVKDWEYKTTFKTEEAIYKALYSRDVNNYIAVKETNKEDIKDRVKLKGAYGWADLKKNPQNEICNEAVVRYLLDGTAIQKTIHNCKDLTKFVTVRRVRGGAVKKFPSYIPEEILALSKEEVCIKAGYKQTEDKHFMVDELKMDADDTYGYAIKKFTIDGEVEYLGGTVRWYYSSKVEGEILIAKTGGKVPKSEGARPMQDMLTTFPDDIDYEWYINESYSILKDIGAIKE